MKKLILLLFAMAMVSMAFADVITVGTGTSYTYEPIASFYGYHRSAAIYTSAEVGGSGTINTISYKAYNTTSTTIPIKVYMKITPASSLAPAQNWSTLISGLTPLYEGNFSGTTAGEWKTITLTTPFAYTGSNLQILIECNYGGSGTSGPQWYNTTAANLNQYIRKDTTAPSSETGTVNSSRPNVQLDMSGYFAYPPTFAVNLPSVAFGNVVANTTTAYTDLIVSNGGSGTLNISSVSLGGTHADRFILDMNANPTPWALTAGQSKTIKLAFNPIAFTNYIANLQIVSDARINHNISLTGTGIDPTITSFTPAYFEGFEGATFPPLGWMVIDNNNDNDKWISSTTPRTGSKCAAIYTDYNAANDDYLVSPALALTGNQELKFWVRAHSSNEPEEISVLLSTTTPSPAAFTQVLMPSTAVGYTTYTEYSINLSAYTGTVYISFTRRDAPADGWYLYLDDVSIRDIPSTPIISLNPNLSSWDFGQTIVNTSATKQFTVTNIGGALLNLNSINTTGAYYSISVNPTPVSLAAGASASFTVQYAPTAVGASHTGSFVINDNRANTTVNLSGSCFDPSITSFPHIQNFDTVTAPALPFGWTSINVNGDTVNWATYAAGANSAPNCASISYNGTLALNDWLVSPPITLEGGTTYAVDFKYRGGSTSYIEKLKVMLGGSNQVADMNIPVFVNENINFIGYTSATATFSVPASGTFYLGWHAYSVANQLRLYVDDVTIRIPAPEPPLPAAVAFPLHNSLALLNPKLKWIPAVGGEAATSYKVYLNEGATFNESHVVYEGTAIEYQTTGLSADRNYYWKVLPTNAYGSDPACPTWTFATPSVDQLAEGFETTTFPPLGWANGSTGAWTRSTSTPLLEGSASAYKYTSTSAAYVLSTPLLAITANNHIRFYSRASATSQVLKIVYSTDRITWTQIGADITYAEANIWYPSSVNLSSLAGSGYYIGFQTPVQTTAGSIYIDHVIGPNPIPVVPGTPTLTAPANAATNQSTQPLFTWNADTAGGIPSGYNIYLDRDLEPSTLIGTSTSTSYSPSTPLDWNTTYYWKVAATNNAGVGVASAVRSFTTMSDPTIYDLPWFEDFGTVTADWPVLNWTQLSGLYPTPTGTSAQWYRYNWLNGAAGNNAARCNIYGSSRNGWLLTPPIVIPADGYELKFDLALTGYNNSNPISDPNSQLDDKFIVAISSNPNMSNPVILREWNNTNSNNVYNSIPHTGTSVILDLNGFIGAHYIAFYGESTLSGGDNDLFVDNVMVRIAPSGPPDPVTLVSPADEAVNLSRDGFPLIWTPALTGGTPAEYTLFMGPSLEEMYDNAFYNLSNPSFNPVVDGEISFAYSETWYWTVMASNGDGDADIPAAFSFTIMNDPSVINFPYSENFDGTWSGSPAAPLGWTVINANNDSYLWSQANTYISPTHSTPYSAHGMGNTNDYLISPALNLTDVSARMMWWDKVESSSYPNSYKVLLSTTNTEMASFTEELANIVCSNVTWTEHTLYLNDYIGQTVYIAFWQYASPSTVYGFGIDDFLLEELVNNDLALTAFSGDTMGIIGNDLSYTVSVSNPGTVTQNAYSVELQNATGQVLSSIDVSTPIASGATVEHTIVWAPDDAGVYSVNARVVLAGDVNMANDFSESITVGVYAATSYIPFIGDPQSTASTTMLPFNVYYKNSLAETIYMAHEMQMASGTINAIMYHNNFTQDINIPVKIWMQHTTEAISSAWLPYANYTLVYDGLVFFPAGINTIVIPLQNPFAYTGGNLAVRTNRVMDTQYYNSNDQFYYTQAGTYPNRSRYHQNDSSIIDPANPALVSTGTQNSYIPNTAFIVDPYTAIPALVSPIVQIDLTGSAPRLTWEAVAGAYDYVVYGSNDPNNWDNANPAVTTNLSHDISLDAAMYFYKVIARSYNNETREIGQIFNPAAVVGSDHKNLKKRTKTIGTENKD